MKKFKGKFISAQRNQAGDLIVFFHLDGRIQLDNLSVRERAWRKGMLKYETKLEVLEQTIQRGQGNSGLAFELKALRDEIIHKRSRWEQYQQVIMAFSAGIAIDKFWEGKYRKPKGQDQKNRMNPPPIPAQSIQIRNFSDKCIEYGLRKGEKIPIQTLYQIMFDAKIIDITLAQFDTKSKEYRKGREYASRLGYSQKGSTRHPNK